MKRVVELRAIGDGDDDMHLIGDGDDDIKGLGSKGTQFVG